MDTINVNQILNRCAIKTKISNILNHFEENKNNLLTKRGIYIYGNPGSGKSHFIKEILKELNYDMIMYDAGDIRNKSIIDTITKHNMSDQNILSMFYGKTQKIAIVMDEIDGMNSGDKGGINALIKLIRQKKTKKQKTEGKTMNPIICIGNYYTDKKMRELMKVCNVFELPSPEDAEITKILKKQCKGQQLKQSVFKMMVKYIQGDMRKLNFALRVISTLDGSNDESKLLNIFQMKSFNEDSKSITNQLLENNYKLSSHNVLMNETDRTIVALLWHENIIDKIKRLPKDVAYPLYYKLLRNICFADYIDRITFQSQIWEFNEMSSLIKTFYNNYIFHKETNNLELENLNEIRFTKVLTKYSTEYNNSLFIQDLSQKLSMDKKDLLSFFQEIRLCNNGDFSNDNEKLSSLEKTFEDYDICKLDIKRMYRYLDKSAKKEEIQDDF